jgi:hypothetical protein
VGGILQIDIDAYAFYTWANLLMETDPLRAILNEDQLRRAGSLK